MTSLPKLVAAALVAAAGPAAAQGLVYVDAKDGYYPNNNLFNVAGSAFGTIIEPGDNSSVNADGRFPGDGVWHWANFGAPWGTPAEAASICGAECTSVYESQAEDAPMIGMRLGLEPGAAYQLNPGTTYDVYVAYWGDVSGNWGVRAGLSSTTLTTFDFDGAEGQTQGSLASAAAWTVRPLDNRTDGSTDAFYTASDDNNNPFLDVTPGSAENSWRTLRIGLVGQATPNAQGQIDVFINDLDSTDAGMRSFFDGLAFVPSGTPVFTTAAIDRTTGSLIITNPTPVDFQISSVSVRSVSGSLNATLWNNISNNNVINDPDNDWVVTSPVSASVTELAEGDGGDLDGVTWVNGGTTLNLGNVWRRGIFEDVVIDLNLVGGGTVQISPTYSGATIQAGDFDADGDIDVQDYIRLVQGLHVSHPTTSVAYSFGDINGSGQVNRNDVLAFAETFDVFNGAGAFAEMVASLSVPEPTSGVLGAMAAGAIGLVGARRRRRESSDRRVVRQTPKVVVTAAVAMVAMLANSALAVPVTGWQVDPLVPGGGSNLGEISTNSPYVGIQNGDGTKVANSADQTAFWGSIPFSVNLVNGQEVALTGSVRLHNDDGGGASINNGAFRWGIFQDDTPDEGNPTGSWLGYLASSSSNNQGVGDGRLDAKNPDATDWETATPLSTVSSATTLGATNGRMFNLAQGGSTSGYVDGTYEFGITIGRYGDEVTVSSYLRLSRPEGDYNNDGRVDAADYTVWRDSLGTNATLPNRDAASTGAVSQADYTRWDATYGATYQHRLGGGTDTNAIPHPLFPQGADATGNPLPVTPHLTFSYNRVGFLLADHLNADFAQFQGIDISARPIESITLEVNTATGAASFKNVSTTNFSMTYYEITSGSGSLVEANWNSLAGSSVIDGVGWDEAAGSNQSILSEINLLGTPTTLAVGGPAVNLGNIWSTSGSQDLSFFFIDNEGTLIRGVIQYVGGATSIPEPSAGVSAVIAVLLAARRWRRS